MIQVYDPRGAVGAEKKATAARIPALKGLRLGILDNTKWNANKLLREVRDQLKAAQSLADIHYYRKESFSKFAAPELIEEIRRDNDIVVTAIGD
jgi:hypothetical protein